MTVHPEEWDLLIRGMAGESTSQVIEDMEKRGQSRMVENAQLPTDIIGDRKVLEDAGVVFGEPYPDDDLFAPVQLPEGWKIQPSDHSMWSYLVDADGKERASIFYKAAFYDRSAHMGITNIANNTG